MSSINTIDKHQQKQYIYLIRNKANRVLNKLNSQIQENHKLLDKIRGK